MDELNLIQKISVFALPVIFAITGHEAAHAYAARHFGDNTAYLEGRMTLNPLRHIDWIGTVLLPLVFPAVVSAGFIIGGSHGQGAMRKAGKTTGYYRMTEASLGLLGGAQSQALFISFMTEAALNSFLNSRGWTVGVDGTITFLSVGANARVTTQTVQQPIVGFVLTNGGLMANISINGNRITQLDL